MVVQQAAQSCSPPDIRVQYLRQIHANHEVRPLGSCPRGLPAAWPAGTAPSQASLGSHTRVMGHPALRAAQCSARGLCSSLLMAVRLH